jgi:hypothetical protein
MNVLRENINNLNDFSLNELKRMWRQAGYKDNLFAFTKKDMLDLIHRVIVSPIYVDPVKRLENPLYMPKRLFSPSFEYPNNPGEKPLYMRFKKCINTCGDKYLMQRHKRNLPEFYPTPITPTIYKPIPEPHRSPPLKLSYSNMPVKDLKAIAKQHGIKNYGKMKKAELLMHLRQAMN